MRTFLIRPFPIIQMDVVFEVCWKNDKKGTFSAQKFPTTAEAFFMRKPIICAFYRNIFRLLFL